MTLVTSFCHYRNGLRPWVPVEHSEGHLLRIRKTLHATNIPYVFSLVGYIPFRSGQTGTKNSGSQPVLDCPKLRRGVTWKKCERNCELKNHETKIFLKYETCLYQLRQFVQRVLGLSRLRVRYYDLWKTLPLLSLENLILMAYFDFSTLYFVILLLFDKHRQRLRHWGILVQVIDSITFLNRWQTFPDSFYQHSFYRTLISACYEPIRVSGNSWLQENSCFLSNISSFTQIASSLSLQEAFLRLMTVVTTSHYL